MVDSALWCNKKKNYYQILVFWFVIVYQADRCCCLISDQQKLRINSLQHEYEEELEVVREEFDTERSIMVDQHNIEMNDIADILFAMEQNFQDRENEAKSEFQSMTDEIRNKVRNPNLTFLNTA